ncbi:hypothetical protein DB88DRAFT_441521 [Papiliotrema laurentii]|uniref:RRM domain-containing protein n=1 Tax=Papiliotrema laurentii TaxID=5418 RepID=A0AAD9CUV6_PAPLA|nr:hypothetical protein DB88DRAFT_441521 [Papiliotrema laurentii]
MPTNAPIPGRFEEDPRVSFDKTAGKWQYEDDETGQEYEWSDAAKNWIPLIDEADWKAQQAAYAVAGVDENTPANAVLAREERRNKKKEKGKKEENGKAGPSNKPANPPSAPKKTAVWVTNLPPNTTLSTLASVFSKAGVLLIGDDGEPRIKMYYDDDGKFKGEALVMYFKEGSVDLAITLLDDTELEMGAGFGNMRVRVADYEKSQTGNVPAKESGKKDENEIKDAAEKKRKPPTAEEKLRMSKRIRKMQEKLTWHSDSDSDDYGAPTGGAPKPGENRNNRVVVLKGMFKPSDLDKEPELLIELKEDVREEAETLGEVTSVVIYDKEEEGVMTIKFKDAVSAQACVMKMNGRWFDGRQISAAVYTGRERFKRSGAGRMESGEGDEDEQQRLDKFAQWLVEGENEGES